MSNVNKIINRITKVLDKILSKNVDEEEDNIIFKRSNNYRDALIKIIKLLENIQYDNNISFTQGQGLKILTTKQMLSRLPILLAQAHAGNNSAKLKNKIRQLLYSLYRSKKISKTVHNNLIATI